MKIERSLALRDQAVTRLNDVYSMAEIVGLSSSEIQIRVFNQVNTLIINCPEWVKQYIKGYERCIIDNLYRYKLEYGAWVDGVFYSTHSNSSNYYRKSNIEPQVFSAKHTNPGHYWIAHEGNKPYYANASESL